MKTRTILTVFLLAASIAAFGRPGFGIGPKPAPRPPVPAFHHPPRPRPMPPPRHHSTWGRGGRNFWPAFGVGTLVGAALATTVVEQPTVVVQAPGRVWVPPVYETRPIYDVFGRVIGYERVLVVPGYWR